VVAGWGSIAVAAEQLSIPAEPLSPAIVLALPGEPDAIPTEEALPALDLDLDLDVVTPSDPIEKEAVCSPPPQCFRDRDCDPICGKRQGVCRRVNSCYNECICSAV
jgi:hypothetical protein